MQHKLREDIRRLTANIEQHYINPDKQVHVAVWREQSETSYESN